MLDGKPWVGRGAGGEIGHVVVRIGGERCGCGRRGCMEAYAGRGSMERRAQRAVDKGHKTALFELMEKRGRTRLASGIWERALKHGDDLAVKLVDEAVEALGAGVASVQNVLDVEAIVIGGGLGIRLGEPYAQAASATRCCRTCSSTPTRRSCRSPSSATWAARSARRCSSRRPSAPPPEPRPARESREPALLASIG